MNRRVICLDSHSHSGGIDLYNYQHTRLHTTQNMRDLALKMQLAGIDYFVVYPMASSTYFDSITFLPTRIDDFPYELSNKSLIYESGLFGTNASIFPAVHPTEKVREQIRFLEDELSKDTISGLKFHPLATHTTVNDLFRSDIARLLKEYNLPITVHSSDFDEYSDPKLIFRWIEKNPEIVVNVAHCGFFDKEFYKGVGNFEKLYIDTSSFSVLCKLFENRHVGGHIKLKWEDPSEALLELFHIVPDRLMWGTDEPWTCYTDYNGNLIVDGDIFKEKRLLDSLPKEVKEKISYYNPLYFLQGHKKNENKS